MVSLDKPKCVPAALSVRKLFVLPLVIYCVQGHTIFCKICGNYLIGSVLVCGLIMGSAGKLLNSVWAFC